MDAMTKGARMDYDSLYIGGEFVPAEQGTEEAITPIDGSVIGSAPVGTPAEARKALDAAHASFEAGLWADADRRVRSDKMQMLLDMVLARKDEVVRLMMLEMGYTRMECEGQLQLGTDQMAKFVELSAADPLYRAATGIESHRQG